MKRAGFATVTGLTRGLAVLLFSLMLWQAAPLQALSPEEILSDPQLEERARALSKELRCLVCQNQSIDDSDAPLAHDLRLEVRQLLGGGLSDGEVLDRLQQRYGDYILLSPPLRPATYALWLAPLVILLLAGLLARYNWRPPDKTGPNPQRADPDAARSDLGAQTTGRPARFGAPLLFSLMLAGGLGLAGLIYATLGRPDLPDSPFAARQAEREQAAIEARQMQANFGAQLEQAEAAAKANPQAVTSWLDLAMAAAAAGKADIEMDALAKALQLTGPNAAILAMQAEALSRAADGQITAPARQIIARALKLDPDEPRALFLTGMAAWQDEDFAKAAEIWQQVLQAAPPGAPWRGRVRENLQMAADRAGIALDLPDAAEQAGMIEQMVAGLAERLRDTPEDTEGWLRLARSLEVLERPEQAFEALAGAAKSAPEETGLAIMALEKLLIITPDPDQLVLAGQLADQLLKQAPDRLEGLFFKGHILRLSGETQAARQIWQKLLARMPADGQAARLLQAELAKLPE
jgi:cytochrome c-type biogenesis protein CcmH